MRDVSTRLFALLLLGAAASVAACSSDRSETGALEARAKVTRAAAERTALASVVGGVIKGGGIEEEGGKLIWSFDIGTPASSAVKEVAVDALTGALVTDAQETAASKVSEAAEQDEEGKPEAGEKAEGDEKDEAVTLAQLPEAVKAAIAPYASDSEIKKIEKGDVDGTEAYEFELEKAGKTSEVTITPAGKLLGTEEPVELADVPAAARQTIADQAAGGKLVSVEKVVEGGTTKYEAIIEKQGKQTEVVVGLDGKVGG
jgi:hypothetical protein